MVQTKILRIALLGVGALVVSSSLALAFEAAPSHRRDATHRAAIDVDADLAPRDSESIRARATVEISASPTAVRDAILDLDARVADGWMVDGVSVYRDEVAPSHIHRRARWALSILGYEINYHCTYDWNAQTDEIVWSLDESQSNDLEHAGGVYQLRPGAQPDVTTLTYTVEVGSRHRAAAPLKRRITKRNVAKLLESVRQRAEAGV